MLKLASPADCCGCTACASVCPKDAIAMTPDAMGFLYPKVDESRCVECGMCLNVCAFNEHYDTSLNLSQPDAYAARHKDMSTMMTSRSGAAFIAISDRILEKGGVVYGAGYTDHFRVVHKRATNAAERDEFKGSKYVQSDLGNVFRQVKQDLIDGKLVLFSGTPCQTSGLHSYVGRRLRERLYLVDIVCHGVPAPYLWRDYLAFLEQRQGSKICWVDFRDKQAFGWRANKEKLKYVNGGGKMSYTFLFYKHIFFRHSCGKCHFTNTRRPSDITIADFWGWQKTDPDFNKDDRGCSLVLVNTEKGRSLFAEASVDMHIIPAKLENCMQPNLEHPSVIHPQRMELERDYARRGFRYVYYKYGEEGWRHRARIFRDRQIFRIKRVIKWGLGLLMPSKFVHLLRQFIKKKM